MSGNTELIKMVKDAAGEAVAERLKQFEEEQAKRDAERGRSLTAEEIKALIDKAGTREIARTDPATLLDPHKGKGLGFVRYLKAHAIGKAEGIRPSEAAKRLGYGEDVQRALQEQTFADGGALVPDQQSAEFIELARAAQVMPGMGMRSLGFKGSMSFGRQNAAGSASYIGEGSNITKSQPTVGQLQMSAKKLAALVPVSNDLMRNPSAGAEALVRDDLISVMALKKDLTYIRGTGSAYSPKGLRYHTNSANVFAQIGTTLQNKVDTLGKAIRLVEEADIPNTGRRGFLMTPRTKWALALTLDSNGNFVFMNQIMAGVLFGYPFGITTQIPNNLGGGTNESELYFQDFGHVVEGVDTGLIVEAFPNGTYHDGSSLVSGISADETVLRAIERHDLVVRYDKAGSVVTGVTWGA